MKKPIYWLKSRKLLFAGGCVLALVAGFIYAQTHSTSETLYSTFTTGLEVLAGLYLAGNVAQKATAKIKGSGSNDSDPE